MSLVNLIYAPTGNANIFYARLAHENCAGQQDSEIHLLSLELTSTNTRNHLLGRIQPATRCGQFRHSGLHILRRVLSDYGTIGKTVLLLHYSTFYTHTFENSELTFVFAFVWCLSISQGTAIAGVQEPLLQLCCLDSSLAISPVFKRFKSVVITSGIFTLYVSIYTTTVAIPYTRCDVWWWLGTLSPIDLYPKLLNFHPAVRASLPMSTFRPCLLPLVVTRGSDQTPLSTKFDQRTDLSIVRNYGALLLNMAANVPDGICCFFTSYWYMEFIITKWDELGILQKVSP